MNDPMSRPFATAPHRLESEPAGEVECAVQKLRAIVYACTGVQANAETAFDHVSACKSCKQKLGLHSIQFES